MPMTDFVGDFLTVVRNASRAKKEKVTLRTSALTTRIAELLKEEGFIENFKPFSEANKKSIRIHLKYLQAKAPAIRGMKRISKPGLRTYAGHQNIRRVQGGLGISIVSTSKGVLTDREARKQKVGGEVLCTVW